jgi:hypothetical protein
MPSLRLIESAFARARVSFKVLGGPIAANPDILQMDIHRSARFGEYVRLWPGASDNLVAALDGDATFQQVLLRVKEPRRPFTRALAWHVPADLARLQREVEAEGGRVLEVRPLRLYAELWTPERERRYLCGKDDVNLFLAEVPRAESVREAHEALKPTPVQEADRRYGARRVARQGEWFFIPPDPDFLARLLAHCDRDPNAIRTGVSVGEANEARPHVADVVIRMRRRRGARPTQFVYARGVVRHADHRPVELPDWRRVVLNLEVRPGNAMRRLRWVARRLANRGRAPGAAGHGPGREAYHPEEHRVAGATSALALLRAWRRNAPPAPSPPNDGEMNGRGRGGRGGPVRFRFGSRT